MLARVAERCGETAALRLACCHGGRQICVRDPRRLVAEHPLVETIDEDTARALHEIFGRGHVLVPMGPARKRRRRVQVPPELRGASASSVARELGYHVRTATRLRTRS